MDNSFNFNKIIDNLYTGNYPKLGGGSGRRVFDLHNRTVLKMAKNIKGYAQNQVEIGRASCRERV